MRISDWSSDVCSSDLHAEAADGADALAERADDEVDIVDHPLRLGDAAAVLADEAHRMRLVDQHHRAIFLGDADHVLERCDVAEHRIDALQHDELARLGGRSEEHTSELQSLMRISSSVFCLKK